MGVHDVERHLHRVELESVIGCDLQHVEVDVRIFVAGEPDVADLACLLASSMLLQLPALRKCGRDLRSG